MQQQAINITSEQAPGHTRVGGLMDLKSLRQTLAEDKQKAEQANNVTLVQSVATDIRRMWSLARMAKEMTVEPRMLQSLRQRRGEYDPNQLAQINEQGGSRVYMMLTANKCRAASSWLKDVYFTAPDDKPWQVKPSPVPDMPPNILPELIKEASGRIEDMLNADQVPPSDMEVREMLMQLKDQAMARQMKMAEEAAVRMDNKMYGQMLDGAFLSSLMQFADDVTTFPSAFMKGPVVRMRPQLKWIPGPNGQFTMDVKDDLKLEWERVDPFMMYPAPDASSVEDGWLIERHRLQRSDLTAMLGVEGYQDAAIRGVLDDYGKGGLHEWLYVDMGKAMAEGKSSMAVSQNPSELIDALQFWGNIQGKKLIEWGMTEAEIPDPYKDYPIEAWLIGTWVIKATVNPDPLGRKPYFKASYEEIPGTYWGNSVCDLCRDTQDVCNGAARALVNNMSLSSGPQVVYNVDRLPEGENLTQLFPWKIWQATSDPMGGTQPPVSFFQPTSVSQELMQVYDKFAILADEYTGIPRYMTGDSPSGGAGRTASGMSMLMSNAGKSIKQVIANIDAAIITPSINRLYYYNMRYGDDPDLKGDIHIVVRGASSMAAKESAAQRQNEFLSMALNSPIAQQVLGMDGIAALMREVAKQLNMDVNDVIPTDPELKMKAQELKNQTAQAQAAQAQGGQAGAPGAPGAQAGGQAPGTAGGNAQAQGNPQAGGSPAKPPGQTLLAGTNRPVTNNFAPAHL